MSKMGRPTKYEEDMPNRLGDYLATTGRENTSLPTISGFALYLGINKDTMYEWAKIHPDFSDSLKKLLQIQEGQLIDDGIYGGKEVNSTIVKLLLQNNHGMKERTDTTTDDKPLPTPIYNGKSGDTTE